MYESGSVVGEGMASGELMKGRDISGELWGFLCITMVKSGSVLAVTMCEVV